MKLEVQDFGEAKDLDELLEVVKQTPIRRVTVNSQPTKLELTSLAHDEAFYTVWESSGTVHLRRTPKLGAYQTDWYDERDYQLNPEDDFDKIFNNIALHPGEAALLLTDRDPEDQKSFCAYVRVPKEEDLDIGTPPPDSLARKNLF